MDMGDLQKIILCILKVNILEGIGRERGSGFFCFLSDIRP